MWATVIPPVATALRERSREISVAMLERIGAELPDLIADPDGAEANRASNEANVVLVAELLERGADPRRAELPPPTLAYATVGAHQNVPLPGLMRAYRLGHLAVWEQILALLRAQVPEPETFAEAVALVSAWLHLFVDASVCLAEDAYTAERERWLRTSSALQTETIAGILDGVPADPGVASTRLGYELDREHLAFVAWLEGAEHVPDPVGALEAALREATVRAGGQDPLIQSLGLVTVAAWVGAPDGWPEAAVEAVSFEPDELGPVRIAVGEPGHGIEGFRRTHLEAMQARRVATLAGRPSGAATRYSAIALTALATSDLELAESFVRRQLGPLAAGDETALRLAATTRAYLDEGASHGRAAGRLGIHENTVRYRVRQAEGLLERPIRPGDLNLRVALALFEHGPALGGPPDRDPDDRAPDRPPDGRTR